MTDRHDPDGIEVRCYAGSRADETPRSVVISGEVLPVIRIGRRWLERSLGDRLDRYMFAIELGDGKSGILECEVETGRWSWRRR